MMTWILMMMPSNPIKPIRGEIWWVNFNAPITAPTPPIGTPKEQLPTTGDEIYKSRPAVVLTIPASWNLALQIVVPITSWQEHFQINQYFWMVKLQADGVNNLNNDSAANILQIKSVSHRRFGNKIGMVSPDQLNLITATVAFCIGYKLPRR
ncbi:MAG: type II toxin-antitoxin system PemK/MazF family toxin [bacterium]|nr:type II toxin-antitoxin system PemK/MazF family toxin [bacterium]